MNIFLTGRTGIGKSTIMKNVLDRIKGSIGGFIVFPSYEGNKPNYEIVSLYDGEYGNYIGTIKNKDNRAQYSFDLKGKNILEESLKYRDILYLDEIGIIENSCYEFQKEVHKVLDSKKTILGVIKKERSPFIDSITKREDIIIIEVTEENRDSLEEVIIEILKKSGIVERKSSSIKWTKTNIENYKEALINPENNYPKVFIDDIKNEFSMEKMNVIDVGSGIGAFTIPISKICKSITAVDESFAAIEELGKIIREKKIKNIKTIIGNYEDLIIENYDLAISAYAGNVPYIDKLYDKNKLVYIIAPKYNYHRNFKVHILNKILGRKDKFYNQTIEYLKEYISKKGVPYKYKEIDSILSQYFHSLEEGKIFFYNLFSIKDEEKDKTDVFIRDNIIIEKDKIYMDNKRESSVILIFK